MRSDPRARPELSPREEAVLERGPTTLNELLDRIADHAEPGERVSLGRILHLMGRRSHAPLLLMAGLVIIAPGVGDLPGLPVVIGLVVILGAGQLLLRNGNPVWLPRWLRRMSLREDRVRKMIRWLRPIASFSDRWTRPRLKKLVGRVGTALVAAACILVAALIPVMEVVPFSASVGGVAITAFGLALITEDGLLALLALLATSVLLGILAYVLL